MNTNKPHVSPRTLRVALTAISLVALPIVGASHAFAAEPQAAASHASTGTVCRLLSGYQFTLPADWRAEQAQEAVRLRPAGTDDHEVYAMSSGTMDGVSSLSSPGLSAAVDAEAQKYLPFLNRIEAPTTFKTGCGPALAFSYRNSGKADMDGLLLLTVVKGRVVFLLALAPGAQLANIQKSLYTLFGSLTAVQEVPAIGSGAIDNSPLAREWNARLRNKKLVYLSSYSSGSSGGYSSQKEMRLLADGRFTYSSNSSVSIYVPGANGDSAGRRSGQGVWSIRTRSNTAYLVMIENGQKVEIPLQYRDNKTYLNGVRYFVVDL